MAKQEIEAGMRRHSVAALASDSGEMAALTQVYVDPDQADWGYQGLTAVTRAHRGRRLGMPVKTAMLAVGDHPVGDYPVGGHDARLLAFQPGAENPHPRRSMPPGPPPARFLPTAGVV